MQSAIDSVNLLQEDKGRLQQANMHVYTREGTPITTTLETIVTLLETGIKNALSFRHFGFSVPSEKSAIRQVFLNWILKTKKESDESISIVVVTSRGSHLDEIAREYQKSNFSKLTNEQGNKKFKFKIQYVTAKHPFQLKNLEKETDFVFVDDKPYSGLEVSAIRMIKEKTSAKVAWINSQGFKRGVHPIAHGADLSVVGFKDNGEDIGAVIVVPFADATDFAMTRNDTSNTMRENRVNHVLLHILPYLRLSRTDPKSQSASSPVKLTRMGWKEEEIENMPAAAKALHEGGADLRITAEQGIDDGHQPPVTSLPSNTSEQLGGIDLNADHLDLRIGGEAFEFNMPMDDLINLELNLQGFRPIIINITPVPSVYLLLGLLDPENDPDENNYDTRLGPADLRSRLDRTEHKQISVMN